jgi:c-di-AMP phosphodiesterase-like protein
VKIRFLSTDFIYILLSLAGAAGIAFYHSADLGVVVLIFCVAFALLYIALGILQKIKWQRIVADKLADKDAFVTYLDTMSLPLALTTETGSIKWANLAFRNIAGYGALRNINKMIPGIAVPDPEKKIMIGGRPYKK